MYVGGDIVKRNSTTKNSDGGGCVWRPRKGDEKPGEAVYAGPVRW